MNNMCTGPGLLCASLPLMHSSPLFYWIAYILRFPSFAQSVPFGEGSLPPHLPNSPSPFKPQLRHLYLLECAWSWVLEAGFYTPNSLSRTFQYTYWLEQKVMGTLLISLEEEDFLLLPIHCSWGRGHSSWNTAISHHQNDNCKYHGLGQFFLKVA